MGELVPRLIQAGQAGQIETLTLWQPFERHRRVRWSAIEQIIPLQRVAYATSDIDTTWTALTYRGTALIRLKPSTKYQMLGTKFVPSPQPGLMAGEMPPTEYPAVNSAGAIALRAVALGWVTEPAGRGPYGDQQFQSPFLR